MLFCQELPVVSTVVPGEAGVKLQFYNTLGHLGVSQKHFKTHVYGGTMSDLYSCWRPLTGEQEWLKTEREPFWGGYNYPPVAVFLRSSGLYTVAGSLFLRYLFEQTVGFSRGSSGFLEVFCNRPF